MKIIFVLSWIISFMLTFKYITETKYFKLMCCSCFVTSCLFGAVLWIKITNLSNGDVSEQLYLDMLLITVFPLFIIIAFNLFKVFGKMIIDYINDKFNNSSQ